MKKQYPWKGFCIFVKIWCKGLCSANKANNDYTKMYSEKYSLLVG
jgi:hypothetical protein